MTHQEKLEAIRKACVEANPKREWTMIVGGGWTESPVRLADVLLAMDAKLKTPFFETANDWERFLFIKWNLYKDSLEEQSEETVAFIYDLLK
jgi:hypothetical protein